MLSKEAIKSKKKFKRVGWLIKSIALNPTKLSRMKVAFQRMNYEFIVGKLPKKSPGATFTKLDLGGISTYKVSTPNSDPEKILLYFHGGAYIAGSPAAYYPMMSHLAKATGFTIYVPDYRLAPEHHFPSQLNDGLNTYNALIIKILIENPEVSSILDVSFKHAIFWRKHLVGGEMLSLNKIEHKILRKKIQDPRIHFAINCGSVSCPPLGNRIFNGTNLDQQLNDKAYSFINNGIDVKIDSANQIIYLNKIFKWYKKDFGDIYSYLCIYFDGIDDCNLIRDYKVSYERYNWDTNTDNK